MHGKNFKRCWYESRELLLCYIIAKKYISKTKWLQPDMQKYAEIAPLKSKQAK